jgi:proteasome lid subunit RPN8/RPN11
MTNASDKLLTPVYLKIQEDAVWPRDKAFYLLSRDGLFLCRNHEFFSSCVAADSWPGELAGQRPFLKLKYPRIPRKMIETIVGFFDLIAERDESEAAVLLGWNRETQAIELIVPDQIGTVVTSFYGNRFALDLQYEAPTLPPHLALIGDVHSHVDGPAYASWTDEADEAYRPGLHLVVGRILEEPPHFYGAVTVDGTRFRVKDLEMIIEGYEQRRPRDVPAEWLAKVKVEDRTCAKQLIRASSRRDNLPLLASVGKSGEEPVIFSAPVSPPQPSESGSPRQPPIQSETASSSGRPSEP